MTEKKKQVRFTKEVKQFIIDKMCKGYDIPEICRKWADQVPHQDSIYRRQGTDTEFAEQMNTAYGVLYTLRAAKLKELSETPATEVYPKLQDWRQAEATLKRRIDTEKFILAKMAPIFSKKFEKTDKIEVSGQLEGGQPVVIMNYAPPAVEKQVNNLIESDSETD